MGISDLWGSQAEAHEKDLIQRCEQIACGTAHHQRCSLPLTDNATDLRFTRAGQHFVDFLHSSCGPPAKISHMSSKLTP